MIPEVFAGGKSVIHSIDPRIKVALALIYSFVIALSSSFVVLWSALAISVALVMAAQLEAREVLRRLTVLWGFILLIWMLMPLTYPGATLFRIGPLGFSGPGMLLAAQISLKSMAILLSLMALLATMSIATMGHSLACFGIPDKLVHLLLITYRYVFVMEQEYQRLIRAMKIRGFKPGTNLHSYQSYAYLVGMLFVHASARADRVSKAMKCRGFTGRFHSLRQFAPDRRNRLFAVIMAFIIILMATVEVWIQTTHS
jgi:cobalt/nickel transport system permease protein